MWTNTIIFMKNFWNFRRASFNLRTVIYAFPFLLLPAILLFQGCKKDISTIGLDLKEDLLNAVFTDTVTLTAHSVKEDTLNTTGLIFNYLGYLNDPVFGTTTSSIYTQILPSGNILSFGGVQDCDSIVLTLRYTGGFYGDTTKGSFAIEIYELNESMSSSTTYYQNHTIDNKHENLTCPVTYPSGFILKPKPNTKVKLKGDTLLEPHIRIRLKDELGHRFLRNVNEMKSDDAFKRYFKGLYISANPNGDNGCLVNFSLVNSLSGIQLYYKENGKAKQFSLIVKNPDAVRFNSYKHDYKDGITTQTIEEGKEKLYIQAMGGVKTKVAFPSIKALKEINGGKIVINKAELVITNIGENLDLYPTPTRLGIQGVNKSSGNLVIIPDAITGGANYYGGEYNASKSEYRFRITRYLQDIIWKGNYEPYIYLVTEGAAAYPYRLVFKGTNTADITKRLRLEVYYTEY